MNRGQVQLICTRLANRRATCAKHSSGMTSADLPNRVTALAGISYSFRSVRWQAAFLAAVPLLTLLEAAAISYAIVRPSRGFHVVQKTA
jgi:hypothetical protein